MLPEYAKLSVRVLEARVEHGRGLDISGPSWIRLSLGHQRFRHSCRSGDELSHSPAFPFSLTLHAHLFFILQFDYYLQRKSIMRGREHVGRAQLRVRLLENVDGVVMTGWWELRKKADCFLPLDELGQLPDDPRESEAVGAVRLGLTWTKTSTNLQATIPVMGTEAIEQVAKAEAIVSTGQVLIGDDDDDDDGRAGSPMSVSTMSVSSRGSPLMTGAKVQVGSESIEMAVEERLESVLTEQAMTHHVSTSTAMFQKMASAFMSEDDYKALLTVQALILAFNQGIEVGGVYMTRSFILLQRYFHRRSSSMQYSNNGELETMRKADFILPRHLYRFVIASFGWLGVTYSGKGKGLIDAMRSQADAKTVREYLKLAEGDLLKSNFESPGAFRPVYFVAYDRDLRAVVVSIRGTLHANDALTDLVCDYIEWRVEGGYVHSGILAAAQWVFQECQEVVLEAARQKHARNIYITGHSMGGGTAILLTMLMLDALKDNEHNIQCAAFGPPPVVSESLMGVYSDHIDVFVNGEDGVPRLCYGSAVDLQCIMLYCAHISTNAWLFGELPKSLTSNLDQFREIVARRSRSVKLYHPGRVHLLSPVGGATMCFKVAHNYFQELRITRRIIFDHLPDQYERALDGAYVGYLMRELEMRQVSHARPLDLAGDIDRSPSPSLNNSRSNSL